MRSLLVWVIYGMIPSTPGIIRYSLNTIAFIGYLALVTHLSVLWNTYIDTACGKFTQWLEEVMLGRKTLLGTIIEMQDRGVFPGAAKWESNIANGLEKGQPLQ